MRKPAGTCSAASPLDAGERRSQHHEEDRRNDGQGDYKCSEDARTHNQVFNQNAVCFRTPGWRDGLENCRLSTYEQLQMDGSRAQRRSDVFACYGRG